MSTDYKTSPSAPPYAPLVLGRPQPGVICPLCHSSEPAFIWIKDHHYNDTMFSLYKCSECHVRSWWPFNQPDSTYYKTHVDYQLDKDILDTKETTWRWNYAQFRRYPPFKKTSGKTLLDIGCGEGIFLTRAKKYGYEVTGFDFNADEISYAKNHYGLSRVSVDTLESFWQTHPGQQFDVITMFEVLEHLDRPREWLQIIKKLLKPDGRLIISVPNRNMYWGNLEYYPTDLPPHHFTSWSPTSLEQFLQQSGFEVMLHTFESPLGRFSLWFKPRVYRVVEAITPPAKSNHQRSVLARLRKYKYILYPLAQILLWLGYPGVDQYVMARHSQE